MTLEERIEAAYDGLCEAGLNNPTREDATFVLRRAFPELFTDPPTAWIAPWEASEEMLSEGHERTGYECDMGSWDRERFYEGARDAHLKQSG